MKGANDGLWDWDLRKNEIYISPLIRTLLGLQSSDLETTPAEWESRIHPDDLESYHQSIQANLRGETEFYMSEYRARRADGTYRWVLDRGFGLRDEAGEVYRMAGSMGNITARKQAEEALRENQQLLDTILNHMPTLVYLRDAEGRFKLVNRKYEEVHDVDNEKIRRKTLHEVFPKRKADEFASLDAKVLKHHRVQEGEERHWVGEEERTYAVIKFPIFDIAGDAVGVGGVDIDTTDRKRTEKALAEKEAQLRVALDNMPGSMMLYDRDLNHVLFNSQYSELCEFPDGLLEVGGSIRDELRYQADRGDFGPGDKDDLIEQVVATYQRGEAVSYERAIAGSGRTLQINIAPTPDGGYVSVLTDITERKRAEELQRTILESIPQPINVVRERDGTFLYCNEPAATLAGRTPEDMVGLRATELYRDASDREGFVELLDEHGQVDNFEVELQSVDGEPFWTMISTRRITFQGEPATLSAWTVITDRKRLEEGLAAETAKMRMVLQHMSGGIFMIDKDLKLQLFNDKFHQWHGIPKKLAKEGASIIPVLEYRAKRGDYGEGDPKKQLKKRIAEYQDGKARRAGLFRARRANPGDHPYTHGGRRHGRRLYRRHRAQAGRGGTGREGGATPGRAGQHAGRHEACRSRPQQCALQCAVQRAVRIARRPRQSRRVLSRRVALSGRPWRLRPRRQGRPDRTGGRHPPERRSRKLRASNRRQRTDASDLPGADARGWLRHDRH